MGEWVHGPSGQSSSSDPGNGGGSRAGWQYRYDPPTAAVPIAPLTNASPRSGLPAGYPAAPLTAAERAWGKEVDKVAGFIVLALLGYFVLTHWILPGAKFARKKGTYVPTPTISNGVSYYTSTQIERVRWIPWSDDVSLTGTKNVVEGDLHDVRVEAVGDVAFEGNLLRVVIVANAGAIQAAGDVRDSALTARSINVAGSATNSREQLLGAKAHTAGQASRHRTR